MRAIRVDILGAVSVAVDGQPRPVAANKVRTMLAVLALDAGRAVATAELAEELWANRQLGNARNALQAHATRLRKVLASPVLHTVANGYLLDIPRESVDGNRFLDLSNRGIAELPDRPDRALRLLTACLALWRGPALLDAGEGPRCRGAAELFDERRLTTWEALVDARLALGDDRQATAELRQLVAQHPLHERFCEQLMLALYRSGRQSEALELFHRTRRRLDEELGVQPSLALQRRHAAILAQDPELVPAITDYRLIRVGKDG